MKLQRELRLLDVFCITSGTMMSAGLFILPGLAYAKAGPAIIISYFIAGIATIPGLLSQAELSSAMPKAGGSYYFITRSLGPAVGTIYGIITWIALALKSSFALVGITVFAKLVLPANEYLIAALLCLVFIIINFIGIKIAGKLQIVLVFGILAVLLAYVIVGIPKVRVENLVPFASGGIFSILSAAGFVFISYGGLLKVASIGEEVKDPGRVLPMAMILSISVVGVVYLSVIFVTSGVLGGTVFSNLLTPITVGANAMVGSWGGAVLSIVAIMAFTSAANAGIMSASRYPMALSRDELLPAVLGRIGSLFKTPHISIFVTGFIILLTLFLKLDVLVKAASSVVIITYMFSCIALIILRESRLHGYQPSFKAPLYPWIHILGIICYGFLLVEIGYEAFFACTVLIAIGFIIYFSYGRKRGEKESALLHLIERITTKELTSHSLETELKGVIRERDDITHDRFDHIIEDSIILDIKNCMHYENFFRHAADSMAGRLSLEPEVLFQRLMDREKESSTALTPHMAIPHVVVEGEKEFDILIARCRDGIEFSDISPHVHAIFVLAGTKDERNFHLRALSAIAQIVQDPGFEKKWMRAKTTEVLRDIVLLGKRRR
ncbi:amino acid permease [Spirochaetota bacterium]